MRDHDALLRAIVENPAENAPRLVFADWLDEHADAFPEPAQVRSRAQFIRVDIAMSLLDEYDPVRLRWRCIEKPRREAEGWVDAILPKGVKRSDLLGPLLCSRGFPSRVNFTPGQFLTKAKHLLPTLPIGTLSFSGEHTATDRLFRSPRFARLAELHLARTALQPSSVQQLADSPHSGTLERLNIGQSGLTIPAVDALIQSSLFPRLTWFQHDLSSLSRTALSAYDGLFDRVTGPVRLRAFGISGYGVRYITADQIVGSAVGRNLERFLLTGSLLRGPWENALARADLPKLHYLNLSSTSAMNGLRRLTTFPIFSRLRHLGFRQNYVTSNEIDDIPTSREANDLRVLDLAGNVFGDGGAKALARSQHFARSLVLNLSSCGIRDAGIDAILESPLADGLVFLDLSDSPASDAAKERIKAKMGDRVRV